ncbi:FG-GAP repeat domain-containing protein [Spirosoma humi]
MIYKNLSFYRVYLGLLAFVSLCIVIESCYSGNEAALSDPYIAAGQKLALQHCSTCHLAVSPNTLDKETWEKHVLPAMAPRLGLESYDGGLYYAGNKAVISYDDWQKIVAYYLTLAPPKLKPAQPSAVNDWAIFSLEKPQRDTSKTAETTLVTVDTISHQLYTSDGLRNDLTRWDQQLRPTLQKQLKSPAVNAQFFRDKQGNEQGLFTCLGTMLPDDNAKGELVGLAISGTQPAEPATLFANLPRPLQSLPADLNKDGLTDWVVCGFGHLVGGLYWLQQGPNHAFTKHPIREVAGAIQATTGDFNADGWPDLMVLFAHADEGIWLFLNDKKGGFTEQNLLRFPPVSGSTSFQLVDFNKDGRLDILYTSGDNSDYSQILKPYHGVYVYLNEGNFRYKQTYFYPINGCVKAMAADFDLDGDLDIVSIAFFADFLDNPAEGCVYLEQEKTLQFQAHTLPVSSYGRWICMDVTDWDQDGDPDILLGNFSHGFINQSDLKPAWDTHLPFILLKNKTRQSASIRRSL